MHKCNSALQTEMTFFNQKFDQICPKIVKFLHFFNPKYFINVSWYVGVVSKNNVQIKMLSRHKFLAEDEKK